MNLGVQSWDGTSQVMVVSREMLQHRSLMHLTLARQTSYLVIATNYKSVGNNENHYLTKGHYAIGMYKYN